MVLVDTGDNTLANRRIRVGRLAGSPDSTDFTDAQKDIAMNKSDKDAEALTNKSDWTSTDAEFQQVIDASDRYAAAEYWDGLGDPNSKSVADAMRGEAKRIVKGINKKEEGQGQRESTFTLYEPSYTSEPIKTVDESGVID